MKEHFIEMFTAEAMKARQETNTDSNELQYKDLCKFMPCFIIATPAIAIAHLVQDGPEKWQFLKGTLKSVFINCYLAPLDIIPHKIVVRDYLEKLDKQKALENAKKT